MQSINNLSTFANLTISKVPPLQRSGSVILNPLAKSANRPISRKRQFDDGEALNSDKGLCNNDEYFEDFLRANNCQKDPGYIYRCTKGFVWGESSQNNFYKMICCGREWYKDCGEMHSIPHDRRISRHLSKFLALHQNRFPVQYLVITIPKELRQLYRSKEALRKFRRYWVEKLKREGEGEKWQFGVSRYHYAGEDGFTWKPHLNILTIGRFVEKETLRKWRAELSRWFKMEHNLSFDPIPNIYTAFTHDSDKIKHWLSYVTRSTQIIYNKTSADTINGFRNTAPWRNKDFDLPEYQEPEKEKNPEREALDAGYDLLPDGTKEKITWRMKYSLVHKRMIPELVPVEQTRLDELKVIKRGIWKEPKYKPPPPDPEPELISAEIFCPF